MTHSETKLIVNLKTGVDVVPYDDGVAITLSDDQSARVDQVVASLFALTPLSPEFMDFADEFHTHRPTTHRRSVNTNEAVNANVALEMLNDLQTLLGHLRPTDDRKDWDFSERFERVKSSINTIIGRLQDGKPFIESDLENIDAQINHQRDNIYALREAHLVARTMRERIEEGIAEFDEWRRKAIQQNVLFYLAQREIDILTELAVVTQGYLAMATLRRTTIILRTNIDRVLTVTVQALSNAVFVATNIRSAVLESNSLVLGFEGEQIKQMVQRFIDIDSNIARMNEQIAEAKAAGEAQAQRATIIDSNIARMNEQIAADEPAGDARVELVSRLRKASAERQPTNSIRIEADEIIGFMSN